MRNLSLNQNLYDEELFLSAHFILVMKWIAKKEQDRTKD